MYEKPAFIEGAKFHGVPSPRSLFLTCIAIGYVVALLDTVIRIYSSTNTLCIYCREKHEENHRPEFHKVGVHTRRQNVMSGFLKWDNRNPKEMMDAYVRVHGETAANWITGSFRAVAASFWVGRFSKSGKKNNIITEDTHPPTPYLKTVWFEKWSGFRTNRTGSYGLVIYFAWILSVWFLVVFSHQCGKYWSFFMKCFQFWLLKCIFSGSSFKIQQQPEICHNSHHCKCS